MSSLADNVARRSPRRRHDAQASRQALLDAADALFDERGYDAATIREIGDRAGVDAALIARYFGGKEGLYLATLQQDGRPRMPTHPHELLECMLSRSDQRGSGPVPLAMVSPTLSDGIREQVREIMGRRVVGPMAAELAAGGVADAEVRSELLVAIAVGVSLTRAGGTLPALARTSIDELLAVLGPLVEALQEAAVESP
ncbi:MAG TPA: TetR family transcriptional regulator [Solirubrobacteraceae bacterium]|jgi:AcrR family transcriptional regulator|nr:TetR family transcriptional regulator [Solirubrobacteraceae bacterium]